MLDNTRCRLRLIVDAPGILPATVRFPEHFQVQPITDLASDGGCYVLTD